ncbi:MAG: hypothetical protein ACI9G1_000421 [Pirellulaceae bacterium]|jgi:hypothetical protein
METPHYKTGSPNVQGLGTIDVDEDLKKSPLMRGVTSMSMATAALGPHNLGSAEVSRDSK